MAFIGKIINPCLQRKPNRIQINIFGEIRATVDDTMGLDEDSWHEINLHEALQTIVDRTQCRAFFGTLVVGQLPVWLNRQVWASLINMPLRYYRAKVIKALLPVVTEHVRDFEQKDSGQVMKDESNDFVSEIVRVVVDIKDGTYNKAPEYLAEQF
ncbi:hypothetical protein OEA41_000069 [Lepraria neglecta]|uniref:Uncharacterized protein n=1 Tax=Lepraria neglecta TaxID=209136 RepID=A0AAD9ZIJ9_9LECA|nr:hypothetical protein OEA41_000069 [Lepraria neglecta]